MLDNDRIAALAASIAAGIIPVYVERGTMDRERLAEVAAAAVDLARRIAREAGALER